MNPAPSTTGPAPARKRLTEEQKAALRELRASLGTEQGERLREHLAESRKAKQAIRQALAQGPGTVPTLAARSGLAPRQTLQIVACLRKYGEISETGLEGDYPVYAPVSNP